VNEVSIFAAALAGVVSFLSPCVLPLVPGYLSYVSGVTYADLENADQRGADERRALVRTVTANAAAFVIGFGIVFVLLGASATAVGQFLRGASPVFTRIAGIIIIIFGLHIIGVIRIPLLYREKRFQTRTAPRTLLGSGLVGMAFAFGWTPCIGPILAAVLTLAASGETVASGMGLLAVYSLGLGIPFLLAALGINYVLSFTAKFRRFIRPAEITSGVLVIALGVLVFTDSMTWLAGQLGFLNRFAL
jgi:cytochrome c-type biogenesis protein